MRKWIVFASVLFFVTSLTLSAQRKQLIDDDWHFIYGDGSAALKNSAIADGWRSLSLPHDWSVETEAAEKAGGRVIGPFSSNSVGKYQTGFTVGGEGWYQKTLNMTADDLTGRVILYFEGVYYQSWVYVNGKIANFCPYGYSSFRVDATKFLHEGKNNILVKVQNMGNNSRWYGGSGIYRHIWLIKTKKMFLDEWDTYITTSDNKDVTVTALVHNETAFQASGSIEVKVLDADGSLVAVADAAYQNIQAGQNKEVGVGLPVNDAKTWSPQTPYLYTAVISIKDDKGAVVDSFEKRFGFRTMNFSAREGFLLNGVNTYIKGGCVHHDNGMLGAAAFNMAERRKLMLIKKLGYNAVRCSHNLPSENFLDVCDEIGLMVIDECFDQWLLAKNGEDYHRYFAEWSDRDVTDMVRRDRNHPSVIMWSIGNEIPGRIEPDGIAIASRLRNDILNYDTTRPLTAAICGWDAGGAWNMASGNWDAQSDNAFKSLDVGGYNYMYDKYEYDHSKYPDRVICGLESYPKQASENWNMVEKHKYVIGDFVWTAMDYIGEAGIGAALADQAPPFFADWPWFNGHCGDLDLIGKKKPQSYYKDIVWKEKPVTMAVATTNSQWNWWGWQLEEQSWTYPGMEGQNVNVSVYSRAPKVRLYLNGVSKGDHVPGGTFYTGYNIPYEPGTLRVVNLDNHGNEVDGEEFVLKTTGEATGSKLVYYDDDNMISADSQDLCFVTIELIDDEGNVVTSDKQTQISVTNAGAGELIGCCTGSPTDMKSFRTLTPTVFRGRALAIVRGNGTSGEVKLNVEIMAKEHDFQSYFFKNPRFDDGNLDGWTKSDTNIIRYNGGMWHTTELIGFLECFVGWGSSNTLAGQSFSQSTKVLPEGDYTLTFDYNGTYTKGNGHYLTDGTMSGVVASIGGQSIQLESIGADEAQHASIHFSLSEPQAVTFLVKCSQDTNADWLCIDNVNMDYTGTFDFDSDYIDKSVSVPAFGGNNWPKISGNGSGDYMETKLGSEVYNGAGLAFWTASVPRNCDIFRQKTSNLPAGRYGIAAFCAANKWTSSDNDRNPQRGTNFFATTSGGKKVYVPVTTATYGLYSLVVDVNEGENLTLGLHADGTNGNNWFYLAGITMVKLGNAIPSAVDEVRLSAFNSQISNIFDLSGRRIATDSLPSDCHIYIANGQKIIRK